MRRKPWAISLGVFAVAGVFLLLGDLAFLLTRSPDSGSVRIAAAVGEWGGVAVGSAIVVLVFVIATRCHRSPVARTTGKN